MLRSTHLSPRRGWRLTRDELKRDVQLLLGGSYEAQPTAVAIHGSFTYYVLMAASSQFTYDPTWALWMPNGYTSTLQLWQAFMARWFASDIWRTLEGHSRGSGGWTKDTDGFLDPNRVNLPSHYVNIERSNCLLFAMFLILERWFYCCPSPSRLQDKMRMEHLLQRKKTRIMQHRRASGRQQVFLLRVTFSSCLATSAREVQKCI